MMHGREKSDSAILAGKPTNKAVLTAAEPVERRAGAKGNASQQSTRRTQSRVSVSHALERIRQNRNEKRFAVTHPRWVPCAGIPLARIWAGCAVQVRRTLSPEMAAAVKPSEQPRTESCVVSGNGHCEA
jgi:hypothetical protein